MGSFFQSTIDGIIASHTAQAPGATAIEDGDRKLSYHELEQNVANLASRLTQHDLRHEEPICILADLCAEMVIAQLAVIRLGLTCVPLTTNIPRLRLKSTLRDVGARYVLSDAEGIRVENDLTLLPITPQQDTLHGPVPGGTEDGGAVPPVDRAHGRGYASLEDQDADYRTHILYTSGSTGKPKPVQVLERSILHLTTMSPIGILDATDKVAVINNPGFDISLFEIFSGLIAGATLVIVPRLIVTDPFGFREFIAQRQLSVIYLTCTLFGIIAHACPATFHNVKHLLIGGSIANIAAVRGVMESSLPPKFLWNCYGPTEITTHALMHQITPPEFKYDNISLGKPFGDGRVRLVDEHLGVITQPGVVGEVLLTGPGLSRGYVGLPQENEYRFIALKDGSRYYRSGDRARWREGEPQVLEIVGRTDFQVKQAGFRVELEEIQHTLLSSGQLAGAVVVQVSNSSATAGAFLVAFVIPAIADTLRVGDLNAYLSERLPACMIPSEVVFVQAFPLTDHEKVDRRALIQSYLDKQGADQTDWKESRDFSAVVRALWSSLLNKPSFSDTDDFFQLGGTSLQAAALISKLREHTGRTVSMRGLVENARLDQLVAYLGAFVDGGNAPDEAEQWTADARLADELKIDPSWSAADLNSVLDWTAPEEGRLFVTGGTGFVGTHFIARFLTMPAVKEIVCLARAKNGQTPRQRIEHTLERYEFLDNVAQHLDKLTVLEGDITQPNLGLSAPDYTWLADRTSAIFHVAAKVNYCEPYSAHFATNVLGTKNVLELATRGRRMPFHYMSTLDVWGPVGLIFGTRELFEDESLHPHIRSLPFDIGYAPSQWVAEEIVRRARARGLPVAIYRPGFVMGDTQHGAANPDDFVSRLFMGSIRLGAFPHLPNQRMEFVTADYVCDTTLHIAAKKRNLGRSYCIVPPSPEISVDMEEAYHVLRDAGYPLRLLPYWDWVRALQEMDDPTNPLNPLLPMLQEPVISGLSRFQTSRQTPRYDCSNTLAAIKDAPQIQYVPLNAELVRKSLEFCRRKGAF
ncbi:non-ribosomal peptide synthetase [Aspergillus saccharolyticus JOP 1030-1]|uniref:Acetyl-CoA synthetase-like protein n=1 Tax=Aspergillus saccharolyticus JOP 1030-1 TaxID=1450539 RepID=A0A318Z3J8_9EURO|nr:acetyl-CoA synthetase-like protein [Aspergillus saccharolyticus JOP 1030-1]PYH40877.1 acetyl-CoA synthetase-like protein [Aspergillus saccharolyticus JOP 1030-1]